jgi:hypothetical protein
VCPRANCPGKEIYKPFKGPSVADILAEKEARIEELEMALRIIAGYEQCIDNLMGNVDIARKALNKEKKDD